MEFTIRVYGVLLNDRQEVLLSDELEREMTFTKFPGGGVEFGEGQREALKREFYEEVGIQIEVGNCFYFNDFCQISVFDVQQQVVSFYYFVTYPDWKTIRVNQEATHTEEKEQHRWVALSKLHEDDVTFPIDKIVVKKLLMQFPI